MIKKNIIILLNLTAICFTQLIFSHESSQAVIIVPIADLVGDALSITDQKKFQTYDDLPLQSAKGTSFCKRINQALFNEIVEIIDKKDNQVKIKTLNTFYTPFISETSDKDKSDKDKSDKDKKSIYWTKSENIVPLQELCKFEIDYNNTIPKPVSFESKNIENANKCTITLKLPFKDKDTGKIFSAGTRFIKTGNTTIEKNQKMHEVFVIQKNIQDYKIIKIYMPEKLCSKNITENNKLKREEFLTLVKSWANQKEGFIPYIWGGSSFTFSCQNDEITKESELPVFNRAELIDKLESKSSPLPGLDCSGLVARAAQICNIPYYYKNTYTAKNNLTPINDINSLENGDLIIYTGHIIIVSDKKKNKIIESRTNEYGRGRVQEVYLKDIFNEIKTFKDLLNAIGSPGKKIERIDTNGQAKENISGLNFYKLI